MKWRKNLVHIYKIGARTNGLLGRFMAFTAATCRKKQLVETAYALKSLRRLDQNKKR